MSSNGPFTATKQATAATQDGRKERLLALDVLRALAAVAVVAIHVTAPALAAAQPTVSFPAAGSRTFWLAAFLNQWARFSIPAFVLISGVALFYSYGDRPLKTADFLRRRVTAVAVPYLFWSAFYLLLTTWVGGLPWAGLARRFGLALLQGTAMYQLYFVVLILQFYLIFPLLRPLGRSRLLPYLVALALGFQYWLMARAGSPQGWGPQPPAVQAILHWQDRLFPWWLGYFAVGAWLGTNLQRGRAWGRRWWPGLVGADVVLLAALLWEFAVRLRLPGAGAGWAASGFRPLAYIYALVTCAAVLAVGLPLTLMLRDLARFSLGIYLVHPLVLIAWQRALGHLALPLGPTATLLLTLFAVLTGSYALTRLINLLPHAELIIGKS